ncbi:MAG TPA: lysophospholipid acyltransferase family protein [Ktedonobacteraceae bacterium]|nr:lysophospholipid acyltransferase family protein [Ktedonobacteraceae bacterium]
MKQEQDSHTSAIPDKGAPSEQVAPQTPVAPLPQSAQSAKPVAAKKPAKNLYEPYVTPPVLYHTIRYVALALLNIIVRLRVRGLYNVPKQGAFIISSNHLSWTDIPFIPLYLRRKVVYMAKEEYYTSKLAWLVRFLGAFPVKRGEGDRQALRAGEEQLKKGNILTIFPEGTRSRSRKMAKAHAGMGMIALRSGVPVVPVAIWGSEKTFKKFRPQVTISYGEPMVLKPKGKKVTRGDINEATEQVMRKIAEMLPPEYRGAYSEELPAPGTEEGI